MKIDKFQFKHWLSQFESVIKTNPSWSDVNKKGISIKIIMTLFALYFVLSFLAIGVGGYFFLKKEFPDEDPLVIVNTYLLYFFLGDLVIRYLMQKLPVMNIKPMLILPIKKSNYGLW